MRTRHYLAALSLLLVAACSGGCAGAQARSEVLWPTVKNVWPRVKQDVERGAGTPIPAPIQTSIDRLDAAIAADNWRQLDDVDRGILTNAAALGIRDRVDAEEISEGVAESLRERLRQFSDALQELKGLGL